MWSICIPCGQHSPCLCIHALLYRRSQLLQSAYSVQGAYGVPVHTTLLTHVCLCVLLLPTPQPAKDESEEERMVRLEMEALAAEEKGRREAVRVWGCYS